MTEPTPADWHPDPFGRYQHRYWDGVEWTHHVSTQGRQEIDPPIHGSPTPAPNPSPAPSTRVSKKVQRQMQSFSGVRQATDAALFNQSILVVNQKAKLLGVTAEYAVYDQHGQRLGSVREVGNVLLRKALGGSGKNATHKFEIVDPNNTVLIALHRPATFIKSKMIVVGAEGTHGEINQKTVGILGNVRFSLESGGRLLGSINAESRAAWDFSIQDANATEIGRITKTWAGWAKERFTKADNYVVQIHRPLEEPLRSLVIAGALAIDTALKQDGDYRHRRAR
ncbi:phospholipid scramblase-related protein [Nocardioides houyundeii]|uniref:phospholipid scramblase-related protein n=1 Tax=Nocardioides houyundeii TaxID=2045452 RepID=UPI000C76095F|nr:phospholipid scramblase-related protein [Nocardioides houyundeii]